jgi:hypothetical protein
LIGIFIFIDLINEKPYMNEEYAHIPEPAARNGRDIRAVLKRGGEKYLPEIVRSDR